MKDFSGREIIRPKCPHCRAEMVWQGDPVNGKLGYYCRTSGCQHEGEHEGEIIDSTSPDPVWRNLDPDSDNFAVDESFDENRSRMGGFGRDSE